MCLDFGTSKDFGHDKHLAHAVGRLHHLGNVAGRGGCLLPFLSSHAAASVPSATL